MRVGSILVYDVPVYRHIIARSTEKILLQHYTKRTVLARLVYLDVVHV